MYIYIAKHDMLPLLFAFQYKSPAVGSSRIKYFVWFPKQCRTSLAQFAYLCLHVSYICTEADGATGSPEQAIKARDTAQSDKVMAEEFEGSHIYFLRHANGRLVSPSYPPSQYALADWFCGYIQWSRHELRIVVTTNPNLFNFAFDGNTKGVKEELAKDGPKKIDVNLISATHRGSALFLACNGGHTDTVKVLIAYPGTNINIGNKRLATPLYVAAQEGHLPTVALLLNYPDIKPHILISSLTYVKQKEPPLLWSCRSSVIPHNKICWCGYEWPFRFSRHTQIHTNTHTLHTHRAFCSSGSSADTFLHVVWRARIVDCRLCRCYGRHLCHSRTHFTRLFFHRGLLLQAAGKNQFFFEFQNFMFWKRSLIGNWLCRKKRLSSPWLLTQACTRCPSCRIKSSPTLWWGVMLVILSLCLSKVSKSIAVPRTFYWILVSTSRSASLSLSPIHMNCHTHTNINTFIMSFSHTHTIDWLPCSLQLLICACMGFGVHLKSASPEKCLRRVLEVAGVLMFVLCVFDIFAWFVMHVCLRCMYVCVLCIRAYVLYIDL